MCELDWWKRVLVVFLKESRKRKEPDEHRREDGRDEHRRTPRQSCTPKKHRKSPRRLETEFGSSDDFSDDPVRGGKKDNPLVAPSGKDESKNVSFEGEGVPTVPPPGEQSASPGPGASHSSSIAVGLTESGLQHIS